MKKFLLLGALVLGYVSQGFAADALVPIYVQNLTPYALHTASSSAALVLPHNVALVQEIEASSGKRDVPVSMGLQANAEGRVQGCKVAFHTHRDLVYNGQSLQTVVQVRAHDGRLFCTTHAAQLDEGGLVEGGVVVPLYEVVAVRRARHAPEVIVHENYDYNPPLIVRQSPPIIVEEDRYVPPVFVDTFPAPWYYRHNHHHHHHHGR